MAKKDTEEKVETVEKGDKKKDKKDKKADKVEDPKPTKAIDKKEALKQALKQIEKDHGKGAIMRLGDAADTMNVETISTGILPLDLALGVGGMPRGRMIELFGPESSGKTTVALHMIAEAQRQGGMAAFIDAEHALDPYYAKKLGVDIEELLVSQPDTGEQALDITEALIRSGALDVIVIDSVAALVPKAEIEGEMGDSHMGLHARLMSQAMRKLTAIVSKSRTIVVFINQIREKVGIMFGTPEVTTGGRALKFYSSLRIDVRKGEPIKNGTEIIGSRAKVKVVKNKVAPPFKLAEFDIIYGEGVSKIGAIIDMGVNLDIINKSGAWFSYGSDRLGQGKENAKAMLEKNPDILKEIEEKIRAEIMSGKAVASIGEMEEGDIAEEKRKEDELEKNMKEEE
ncbi:MAG: recombinase RecA [Selenomonadaceae bacterium]|nr:recombinase RecA [Selenomonadaceae bacterium]